MHKNYDATFGYIYNVIKNIKNKMWIVSKLSVCAKLNIKKTYGIR